MSNNGNRLPLSPGSTLQAGQYVIQSTLGMGGFGVTYCANDTHLHRKVAIKELFPKGCSRQGTNAYYRDNYTQQEWITWVDDFLHEARLVAQLHHPGIITIYEYFEENDTAYMAMRFIEGNTLAEQVSRQGPLTEAEVRIYTRLIVDTLREVHNQGILHRDIKPSNILISSRGQPVLIDFGAAHSLLTTNVLPRITGTKGFAPPEQYYHNLPHGPYTDIYGLAATIHFLLTSRIPSDTNALDDPRLSQTIRAALSHALDPNFERRPQDVDTFLNELEGRARVEPSTLYIPTPYGYTATGTPHSQNLASQAGLEGKSEAEEDTWVLPPRSKSASDTAPNPSNRTQHPQSAADGKAGRSEDKPADSMFGPTTRGSSRIEQASEEPEPVDDHEMTEELDVVRTGTGAWHRPSTFTEEERKALLSLLEASIATEDDEIIAKAWHHTFDGYEPAQPYRARVEQARDRLAAYARLRAALKSEDDTHIVASYLTILDGYPKVTADQRRRVEEAARNLRIKHHLEKALEQNDIEGALKIQKEERLAAHDVRMNVATASYIARLDPTQLETRLMGNMLVARWAWPPVSSIQVVAIAWRTDTWPQHPEESGSQIYLVSRTAYDRNGGYSTEVGIPARLYVRVFSAMMQSGPLGKQSWVYSLGSDSSSRCLALRPCEVICRLSNPGGAASNAIELWTTDTSPLPDMVLVRKAGGLPLGVGDGQTVANIKATGKSYAKVTLDVAYWPPNTILRLFATNPEDARRLTIRYGHGANRLEVN